MTKLKFGTILDFLEPLQYSIENINWSTDLQGFNLLTLYTEISCSFTCKVKFNQEQDKSSYTKQQPPLGDRKYSNTPPQKRGGGGWLKKNKRENHIILTKYEAVHPTYVLENNSSSGMLIILTSPPPPKKKKTKKKLRVVIPK